MPLRNNVVRLVRFAKVDGMLPENALKPSDKKERPVNSDNEDGMLPVKVLL